jgi:hypothetical protein
MAVVIDGRTTGAHAVERAAMMPYRTACSAIAAVALLSVPGAVQWLNEHVPRDLLDGRQVDIEVAPARFAGGYRAD